jgi:HK97 gp10 family phage protein
MAEMIHIEGLENVKAELAKFDATVQERAMRAGLRAAGTVFQAAVQERAPERPELPSGTALPIGALAADITLSVTKRDGVLMAIVQPGRLTSHVARWVEYGHRLVRGAPNKKGRGGPGSVVGNVPAHPFIRPAFEAERGAAMEAFAVGLASELKKRT